MLTLQQIITEAGIAVPNPYGPADYIPMLNAVNNDFFDKVKIPSIASFTSVRNQASYSLTGTIRAKNIDKVQVGSVVYRNMLFEPVNPGTNHHIFSEADNQLTLSPAPFRTGETGIVRYFWVATTTFVTGSLSASPDAPPEYHWIYTLGLAQRIAEAMDDISKAANYGGQYNAALAVAQQNFRQGGPPT